MAVRKLKVRLDPFILTLSNVANATIATSNTVATILDDDLRFSSVSQNGSNLTLSFLTATGQVYRMEWSAEVAPASVWTPVAGLTAIAGTGGVVMVNEPISPAELRRFYRVVLISP